MAFALIDNTSAVLIGIVLAGIAGGLAVASVRVARRSRQQDAPIRRGNTRPLDADTEVR